MKLRTKKIIAREFLVLIICSLVSILYFIGVLIYNYRLDSQRDDLSSKITTFEQKIDSLVRPFKSKVDNQEWFFNESEKRVLQSRHENVDQLWSRLSYLSKIDSIIYKWHNYWNDDVINGLNEMGFKSGKDFDLFITKNSLTQNESKVYETVLIFKEKISELSSKTYSIDKKYFEYEDQIKSSLSVLLIIGIISFPIRYFIYAIQWSYRTLKQTE